MGLLDDFFGPEFGPLFGDKSYEKQRQPWALWPFIIFTIAGTGCAFGALWFLFAGNTAMFQVFLLLMTISIGATYFFRWVWLGIIVLKSKRKKSGDNK